MRGTIANQMEPTARTLQGQDFPGSCIRRGDRGTDLPCNEHLSAAIAALQRVQLLHASAKEAPASDGSLMQYLPTGAGSLQTSKGAADNNATDDPPPEKMWRDLPESGEAAWAKARLGTKKRIQVAQVQEAMSEAIMNLHHALEECRDETFPSSASMSHTQRNMTSGADSRHADDRVENLQREAQEAEEEALRLKGEEKRLKNKLAALERDLSAKREASDKKAGHADQHDPQLASTLNLLACLRDLAIAHRKLVLPAEGKAMSPEQQAVACFLAESDACRTDTSQ